MAQAAAIHGGETPTSVFRRLGGKSGSGSFAPSPNAPALIQEEYRQNPENCYDYPVAETQHEWQFCFKYGKMISKSFEG